MWVSSKAGSYRPRETIALLVELYVYKYSTWTFQKLDSAKRKISRQTGGMYLEINQTSFARFFTASIRRRRIPDAITNSRLRREPYSAATIEDIGTFQHKYEYR